jgi:hypothetical protein
MARVLPSDVADRIDWVFPWVRNPNPPVLAYQQESMPIAAVLSLIERIPETLLRFNAHGYGNFVWAHASLTQLVRLFQGGLGFANWPTHQNLDAMTTLYQLLKMCPDEAISEHAAGLPFILDQTLRDSIRSDISSAESAFNNGEWKASTVLAAAAVEALLLWSIKQCSDAERQSAINRIKLNLDAAHPENWTLPNYIDVARQLGHIEPETSTEARLAKDFRNLIHPGREIRLNQKCDRGTALSALAALDHIVRDLEAVFGSNPLQTEHDQTTS